MMTIDNAYNIGDIVYLKTDPEQMERIVTAIEISQKGLLYEVCFVESSSHFFDFELSKEKNILKTLQ